MADEKPVFMIVIGRITDKEKMGQYQSALMDSGIYAKNHGHYRAFGAAARYFRR